MANFSLKGMGVALVTPFNADKTIDYIALERLLELHLQSGTDYLVALGTTAENATLSWDEREAIVQFITSYVKDKLPIIVGMGSNNTGALIESLKSFDFKDAHSILSVTPYYNRPTQEGLYQHYKAVSEASPLPIVLYNVPSRTGVNMSAETTLRIANDFKNIIGIKEAHTDIDQVKMIIKGAPEQFSVVSGDDPMTIELIKQGGKGVISVLGNAFPKEFNSIVKTALKGDFAKAEVGYEKISRCCDLLFVEGNPAGVKSALHLLGYIQNELRLPLVSISEETEGILKQEIVKCV
ncbi:MAG TPA: 4-hydroxy-tetrahydrodipicolinate synthase [Dysgonamonadaceae bacterium]|nr:4-hydroxy-tetrahydrodipicolinate synthase [Dysgonamonadaceae bacterium]